MQIDAAILAANQHEIRIGHLPKWKESPFGGEFELSAAQVAFRYYPDGDTTSSPSSWLDIADAVGAKWEKVNRNLPEDQRRVILDNLPEWPADLDTVEARFEWLFRYVAVEVGDGNYIPHEPRQVLQYKYGDCKDLSLLMAELLRLRNIDAYPILVQMPAWRMFDSSYPSMRQFNHCIVAIVRLGDTTYYDPTAKGYDIGALPWADQGAPALWLGESSQFLTLPRDAVPLRLQRTLRGTLDSRGDFAGTLTLSFDARIPDAEWRPTSQNDAYELLQRHLQDKLAADMTAHRVDTANSEFEAEINIRHWAAMHGRDCYWNVNPFGYNLPDTLSLEPATATAYVRRPFITRDELAVKLPATVTAEVFADEQVTLGPDQASFKCHTSADSLAGFWELELHRTSYATHERADLDSLLKSAAGQHRATIKLRL